MKFVYPAGLWALAGVLVVAGVYLFRRKYEEKPVSSVYLWKLAQNFSKRNSPIQRLKRALVAALQLLSVAAACLMIAQPLIPVPGAQVHYAAIVDASASMQIADGQGVSRFQRAFGRPGAGCGPAALGQQRQRGGGGGPGPNPGRPPAQEPGGGGPGSGPLRPGPGQPGGSAGLCGTWCGGRTRPACTPTGITPRR